MSPDHGRMLISAPAHLSISKIVQYIKGKSNRRLQAEFQELKKRYWRQHLLVLC
ncbi:MAG: transposase [Alphaproteobacteria bacterium]|nr:transposase [Alphaproteobacteria bacterium]